MANLDGVERLIALESLGRCPASRETRDRPASSSRASPVPSRSSSGAADAQWPRPRYDELQWSADHMIIDGASHWGLVLNRRVLPAIVSAVIEWLDKSASGGRP
jgi:hypothetical protein